MSVPSNSSVQLTTSSAARSESAARCRPAGQPSVRDQGTDVVVIEASPRLPSEQVARFVAVEQEIVLAQIRHVVLQSGLVEDVGQWLL